MNDNESKHLECDRRGGDPERGSIRVERERDAEVGGAQDSTEVAQSAAAFGASLEHARRSRGLDIEACAHALRLPVRLLRKLEAGDYEGVDYQIYLRGYLTKYAEYLGVDAQALQAHLATLAPRQPTLVATGGMSHSRYLLERYATAATYVVLTAVIVVPLIWLGLRGGLDRDMARLAPLDASPVTGKAEVATAKPASSPRPGSDKPDAAPVGSDGNERPLMASMAPFSAMDNADIRPVGPLRPQAPVAPAGSHRLTLELPVASWVEITDTDGTRLEYALLPAGTRKSYVSSKPLEVRIGDARGVHVELDGKAVDLDGCRRANVAHFRVAAQGGIRPYDG